MQPPMGLGVEGGLAAGLAFPAPLHSPRPPLPSGAPRPQACLCRVHILEAPGCPPRARLPGSPCGHNCLSLGGTAEDPRRDMCAADLAWGPIPPPPSPPGLLLGKVWLPSTLLGQAGLCDGGGPSCPDWSGVCSEAWAAWAWGWAGPRSARWDVLWLRPGPPCPQPRPLSQAGRCG